MGSRRPPEKAGAIRVSAVRSRRGTLEKVYIVDNRVLVMSTEDVSTYAGGRLDRYRRDTVAGIFRGPPFSSGLLLFELPSGGKQ
jgi:hypothetical protein